MSALGKLTLDAMREGFVEPGEEDDFDGGGAFGQVLEKGPCCVMVIV